MNHEEKEWVQYYLNRGAALELAERLAKLKIIEEGRKEKAFKDAIQQIQDCDLSFAFKQGMQHCVDIFRHHLGYTKDL